MTELDRFETRLEARMRSHATSALRLRDPAVIARAAINEATPASTSGLLWSSAGRELVGRRSYGPLSVGLALLLVALISISAVLAGSRLFDPPAPTVTDTTQTPPVTRPEPTVVPAPLGRGGTFIRSGDLATARSGHTAVLLADGRVLVLGGEVRIGDDRSVAPQHSEVFDPRTGLFSRSESIETAIEPGSVWADWEGFSATPLADGRVLVAGGGLQTDLRPDHTTDVAVLFDPVTGASAPTGSMTVARAWHGAVALSDGRVLVVGGTDGRAEVEPPVTHLSAEIYDPTTGTFVSTGPTACPRAWTPSWPFLALKVLASGRVLVYGGGCGDRLDTATDEIFDPATGTFGSVRDRGQGEAETSVILTFPDSVLRYDLRAATVTDVTPQPADLVSAYCGNAWPCRTGMTSTLLADGRILLAGGGTKAGLVLDPSLGMVTITGPLAEPRTRHTATLLPDGRVVLIGGESTHANPTPTRLSSVEIFKPD
jgi:hypothetical protein